MSILDEIARRRRASALRRLGPPPGSLPDHFPMPARRPPPSAQRPAPPAAPDRAHTLESVLPQVLASISALPARHEAAHETAPSSDPVPLLERDRTPDRVSDRPPDHAARPVPPPAPPTPPAPARQIEQLEPLEPLEPLELLELLDDEEVEEVDAEIHIPDAEPVETPETPEAPEPPEAPEAPEAPEPVASTWAKVAEAWGDTPQADPPRTETPRADTARGADKPAPLETETARRAAPRYDAWLPTPDLFKLTSEPITGTLEPITSTEPKPVTSTDLVPVREPDTDTGVDRRSDPRSPSFVERTQLRRRIRFLRQLREVQLRDLGGFALELHRFGRDRPELTLSKIEAAAETDRELRQLEYALNGRVELRVVREAGIGGACAQCGAVYGTEDRFCSNCGEALPGTTLLRDDRRPRPDRPSR